MEEKYYEEEFRERRRKRLGKFWYLFNVYCCYRLLINDKYKILICIYIFFIFILLIFFLVEEDKDRERKVMEREILDLRG